MTAAQKVTVLLIDSDVDSREICLKMFEHHGYLVTLATSSDQGIQLARERQPDVIITDLVTRTVAGWWIPEQLRADPATAAVPVIAVTGYVFPEDRERAIRAGVAEFLPKPVDLERLLRVVESIVSQAEDPGNSAPSG